MGMAPIAHALYQKVMRFNPEEPEWLGRDRFVLSSGHASALLYTMLHLAGYDVTTEDLKAFRQLHSKTPGHPERGETPGVEVTAGPLGQGIANAVGLAIAETHMAGRFNKPGFNVFGGHVYCLHGEGCLQEGVASEAASLAGHLGLGNLICFWDENRISIDGCTDISFTEDALARYESYGWQTLTVADGDCADGDVSSILAAIEAAKADTKRPTLIAVRTTIGYGAAKQNTAGVHGAPIGMDDIARLAGEWNVQGVEDYQVADDVRAAYGEAVAKGKAACAEWKAMYAKYTEAFPELAAELQRRVFTPKAGLTFEDVVAKLPTYTADQSAIATRMTSQQTLQAVAKEFPELMGGSADLMKSNLTDIGAVGVKDFNVCDRTGRYIRWGIREHGMCAIANGIAAWANWAFLPFTATFFVFTGYALGAIRVAALNHLRQLYVFTHDSIGVGEDGATHQPVETLAVCRAHPGLAVFRPADGNETVGAYAAAMTQVDGPSMLALSRQNLPQLAASAPEKVLKGAYIVDAEEDGRQLDLVYVATGSEVSLAMAAARLLREQGKNVRVVSMPCMSLFAAQDADYRRSVIPNGGVPVVSVEAAVAQGWEKYAHRHCGIERYGYSAPAPAVFAELGLTAEKVAATGQAFIEKLGAAAPALEYDF